MHISSTRNPRVVDATKLHQRRYRTERGATLIEGPHIVSLAVAAGARVTSIFIRDDTEVPDAMAGHPGLVTVSDAVLEKLSGTAHPRGPVAVMEIPAPAELEAEPVVVLVDLADPGNVGTLIRSAAAFGFAIAVTPGTADVWSPKVLRSAAGAHFQTRLVGTLEEPLDALGRVGVASVALVVEGGESIRAVPDGPIGLLVGSEAHGLDPMLVERASRRVTLDMPGRTESLNAAIAASIAMYELRGRA